MQDFLHLISGPRNISTALMYSFLQRQDTAAVDEPFYAYYLAKNNYNHPGKSDILLSQHQDPNEVIHKTLNVKRDEPFLFIKNMAHHLKGFDYSFIYNHRNIFLIRDPALLIHSFSKVISNPTANDIGIIDEAKLYDEILEHGKFPPVVIDSGELLKNPDKILTIACEQLDIPYTAAMLQWKKGPKKEDGIWAPHWYKSVHKTTCFSRQPTSERTLGESQQKIYNEVLPSYQKLFAKAIKA